MTEEWIANAHLAGDRTAKVPREQYGAEKRGAWHEERDDAAQQEHADADDGAGRIAQIDCSLYRRWEFQDLHGCVEQQEYSGECRQ